MRILVTGGAGFIGSNLVRSLAACGERVRVLDDLSAGSLSNLEDVDRLVEVISASTTDRDVVREAVAGTELVYHLAGDSNPIRPLIGPPARAVDEVSGTLNVLIAARESGVRRVVYGSSGAVYGRSPKLPTRENAPVDTDMSLAAVKLACEDDCRAFSREFGLETVCLRLFNVFGPREDPLARSAGAVATFTNRMLSGEPPVIFGDGDRTRDFVFVANVVQALILAGMSADKLWGEVINIGSGVRTSLLELVAEINALLGSSLSPVFGAPWQDDVREAQADISKARRLLKYEPLISLRDGLHETIDWYSRTPVRGARPFARS